LNRLAVFLILTVAAPARALDAAAAKADITPDLSREKTYLAGFDSTGRRAVGVHDPLYARILVLRSAQRTVAIVGLDLLGFSRNDVLDLRHLSGFDVKGRDLFIASTHVHSGPDTLGLWGPFPGVSGVNAEYQARIKRAIADALKDAESRLKPARLMAGKTELDPRGLCRDSRDPQIIDPDLAVLRVRSTDGRAIATVVNWSCHPEVLARKSHLVTADFPAYLCGDVEKKTGGPCLFLNGMIGGLMTPDTKIQSFAEAERIGTAVAEAALAVKADRGGGGISFHSETVLVPVENSDYRLFLPALTFGHRLFDREGRPMPPGKRWSIPLRHLFFGLKPAEVPWVQSEVTVVDAGPVRIVGMPAEMLPELAIGGYDGKYSFGRPLITPGNDNAPDLSKAPKPPYLKDLVRAPVAMLVGLANDELGYVIPIYDFKTGGHKALYPHPSGHYEETNSIGPSVTEILLNAAARLLRQARP
jgi:hypothetical protein